MIEQPIIDAAYEILNNPNAATDLKEDAQRALNELQKYKESLPDVSGLTSNSGNSSSTDGSGNNGNSDGTNGTDGANGGKNNGNGTDGTNGANGGKNKVTKSSEFAYDTQGRVVKEIISGSDGSKAVENYTFDMKTNRLNLKTKVNDDGSYQRASFTYNPDGSVKTIAKTTVATDGTVSTVTTTYDKVGNITAQEQSELPAGMQKYQVINEMAEKKRQINK